jgi:hypothetical protein
MYLAWYGVSFMAEGNNGWRKTFCGGGLWHDCGDYAGTGFCRR